MWATRATGTDDIMTSPHEFHFADPVRKLWWEYNDEAWTATALETNVTLIDADDEETLGPDDIHARFQNDDWECAPIKNSPWPFDSGLRFEKSNAPGALAWKIVDSHGGELMQVPGDDGGELVYTLGKKIIRCTTAGLSEGILNDFADFEHRLADTEDYEEKKSSSESDSDAESSDGQACLRCEKPTATGARRLVRRVLSGRIGGDQKGEQGGEEEGEEDGEEECGEEGARSRRVEQRVRHQKKEPYIARPRPRRRRGAGARRPRPGTRGASHSQRPRMRRGVPTITSN